MTGSRAFGQRVRGLHLIVTYKFEGYSGLLEKFTFRTMFSSAYLNFETCLEVEIEHNACPYQKMLTNIDLEIQSKR